MVFDLFLQLLSLLVRAGVKRDEVGDLVRAVKGHVFEINFRWTLFSVSLARERSVVTKRLNLSNAHPIV